MHLLKKNFTNPQRNCIHNEKNSLIFTISDINKYFIVTLATTNKYYTLTVSNICENSTNSLKFIHLLKNFFIHYAFIFTEIQKS